MDLTSLCLKNLIVRLSFASLAVVTRVFNSEECSENILLNFRIVMFTRVEKIT